LHGRTYSAFCDPSGGRHDAFSICVGSLRDEHFTADVIRARRPPFDPHDVVEEFSQLLRDYGLSSVRGDAYSGEWIVTAFEEHGITYTPAEKSKSDWYLEALPLFTRGLISIPNIPPLVRELRLLRGKRIAVGARASIIRAVAGDDLANSVCGCAATASVYEYDATLAWV